jgi:ribonuclease P protein component
MALERGSRLKKAQDFKATFKAQKGAKEGSFLLKARATHNSSSRFGIVVSKSVLRKATARNRMRRLISEALRAEKKNLEKAYDIVVVALPGASFQNSLEAREKVRKLFLKASLTK